MWANGTRDAVEIVIQHEALDECCTVNLDIIPSTAVPSVL